MNTLRLGRLAGVLGTLLFFPAQLVEAQENDGSLDQEQQRPWPTSLEFARCQAHILTSNRINRDDVLDKREFIFLLNTRVRTGFNSSVEFDDINPIYRNAWTALAGENEQGPIVTGSIPGTQTLATIPVLWGICQAVDMAHEQVEASATWAPTPAVAPSASPSPTVDPPLDDVFLNRCNVAIRFSQGPIPGLTQQEYVRALGIMLRNSTLNPGFPFDNLSECYRAVFKSYNTTKDTDIPIFGTINNVRDDPVVVQFCTRVFNSDSTRCDDENDQVPTLSPTQESSPTISPTSTASPSDSPRTLSPTANPTSFSEITTAPTPAPTQPSLECHDKKKWKDRKGKGCDYYKKKGRCRKAERRRRYGSASAADACCVCGGGEIRTMVEIDNAKYQCVRVEE